MVWKVDWTNPGNTGVRVWGRNSASHQARTREWHWVTTGYLRAVGVSTPTYRKDSWEIEWQKRDGKLVWARNPGSKMPSAREWHWIDFHTIERAGLKWKPKSGRNGRYINSCGYCVLTRRAMTEEDIALANQHNLFKGKKKQMVWEHQLVAVKKYGAILPGNVVRHLNGIKQDNRPENLVLGTTQENTMDHDMARRKAMYWREKYEQAMAEIDQLQRVLRFDGHAVRSGQAAAVIEGMFVSPLITKV